MGGFTIWNLAAILASGKWDATLWMKNVANEAGVTGVYTPAYMGTSPQQNYHGNGSKELIALARTSGLTLNYGF